MRGRVKTLTPDRGFGFITSETGTDHFFHLSQLFGKRIEELRPGEIVTFEVAEDRGKGPRASNVWPQMLPAPTTDS